MNVLAKLRRLKFGHFKFCFWRRRNLRRDCVFVYSLLGYQQNRFSCAQSQRKRTLLLYGLDFT